MAVIKNAAVGKTVDLWGRKRKNPTPPQSEHKCGVACERFAMGCSGKRGKFTKALGVLSQTRARMATGKGTFRRLDRGSRQEIHEHRKKKGVASLSQGGHQEKRVRGHSITGQGWEILVHRIFWKVHIELGGRVKTQRHHVSEGEGTERPY